MPPFYDIYGLSKKRDKETIDTFLDYFCYRQQIEDNDKGTDIMTYGHEECDIEDERVMTLSQIIEYGLENPNRSLVFYLRKYSQYFKGVEDIIICFTSDNQLVFGVSVDVSRVDIEEVINKVGICEQLTETIVRLTSAHKTIMGLELAPPSNERELDELLTEK